MLGACDAAPRAVELAELRRAPERYDGRAVAVTGTLRAFDDPAHFWVENDALDRVGLEGGRELRALVGWTVDVRGTFRYDRRAGRRIAASRWSASAPHAERRRDQLPAAARLDSAAAAISSKDSTKHSARYSGSGTISRQDAKEMVRCPS